MRQALFRGIVKAGRFCPDDIAKHGAWLAHAEGKRVVMELKQERALRSLKQNARWWSLIIPTVQSCWEHDKDNPVCLPPEMVHDMLVTHFGGGMVKTPLGWSRQSSREMKTDEFCRMGDKVEEYLREKYKVIVPDEEPA